MFATLGRYQCLQYFLLVLSLLVALATLAALTLTGDRRQIVGANDNIDNLEYVCSYRDIQPPATHCPLNTMSLLEAVLNSSLPLYNSTASVQPLWDTLQHRWQHIRILVLR